MASTTGRQPLEFRLLGPFELASGQRQIVIGSGKQRALLAVLALRLNQVVPRGELIDELWGETPPASATASLHSLASLVRRTLGQCQGAEAGFRLQTREPGYVLEGDPECVDAHRFEKLATGARQDLATGGAEMAAQRLRQALGLWHGRALADLADVSLANLEANRLEELRLAVVEDLADAELACGHPQEAVALLEPHVTAHQFRERAWGQLMLSLYRLGRQADALAAYRRVRAVIVEELGVEPTPALRRLEQQILHQSDELDGPEASRPTVPAPVAVPRAQDETIAFLFTDIEASARRWEGNREATARDLARHDELLRIAVAGPGGEVFAHTGDGLAAAFSTASAALEAAVVGQRTLLEEPWAAGPLRVRMAVHAGSAERRSGNYFGPTLNRAARLMATGWGGQVLCSGAVADLVRDDLPRGVSLVDLGEHNLADLTRPERIFQVAAAGLAADFPPLRSQAPARHNLPVSLTPFVGRASELNELRGLLERTHLVTLTGVGGSGKTRLAVELGAMVVQAFPDGVWLAEFGSLQDPALVADEVSTAVGVPSEALLGRSGPREERLCAHLRRRHTLIILDNCEHLVEASARLVQTLLTRCPDVRLVATSREVLGLPGEVAWNVPPLSLPTTDPRGAEDLAGSDAAALFCERARAAQPGFAPSAANAPAVARICRRLDGIPLALELAAARVRMLSADQIAELLDDRFRLLTGGGRATVPRHQTLRAAMDWSYQALPASEQAVLRRLAVFPASFDLDAATAVAMDRSVVSGGPGFEALDLLSRLVDKSLVVVMPAEGAVRYRLLETVRHYSAERLEQAGEALAMRGRHREHFVTLADLTEGGWPDHGPTIRRTEINEENFVAALAWSLEQGDYRPAVRLAAYLSDYWSYTGRPDGVGWLERALAGPDPSPSPDRVHAINGLAMLLSTSSRGDRDRSERLLHEAVDMAGGLGYARGQAEAHLYLGDLALTSGDIERARRLLTAALEEGGADSAFKAWCLYALGQAALAAGDLAEATRSLQGALDLARRGSYTLVTAHALSALAPLAAGAGDERRAESLVEEALQAAAALGLPAVMVLALTRATEAHILVGDASRPRITLQQLLVLLGDLGGQRFVADALEMAALLTDAAGSSAATVRLLTACRMMRDAEREPLGGTRAVSHLVQDCAERVVEDLVASEFAEERAHGREMTSAEAIAYALDQLQSDGA